jgi:predicted SnoaL-like aldol condensation-catalyzing enzyme
LVRGDLVHSRMADPQQNKQTLPVYDARLHRGPPGRGRGEVRRAADIQHNPMAPDRPQAFVEVVTAFRKQYPTRTSTSAARSPNDNGTV